MNQRALFNSENITTLEGLRFIAFTWVFIGHLPRTESSTWLIALQYTNWVGVQIFFVLSAFLITNLAIKEKRKTGSFSAKNFIIRRALRLLPLYFLITLIGFLIFPMLNVGIGPTFENTDDYNKFISAIPHYAIFIASFSKYFISTDWGSTGGVLGPLWSIMVEMHFYAIFCIGAYVFLRKNKEIKSNPWPILAIIIASSVLLKIFAAKSFGALFVYGNLPGAMESFGFGVLLGIYYNSHKSTELLTKTAKSSKVQLALAVIAIGALAAILKLPHATALTDPIDIALIYSLAAILSTAIFIIALASNHATQQASTPLIKATSFLLANPVSTSLGKVSYGLYLFHSTVIYFSATAILQALPNSKLSYITMAAACILITYVLSKISYIYFESKFIRLSRHFKSTTKPQAQPAHTIDR